MTTGKGVRRLGLHSLLGFMALGRSFTLSAPQGPHLQNTRIELVSRSAVFKVCSVAESRGRACPSGRGLQWGGPFSCPLHFRSFPVFYKRNYFLSRPGAGWEALTSQCWVFGAQPYGVSIWRLLCRFSKGIPFFKRVLPSAGNCPIHNYENLILEVKGAC